MASPFTRTFSVRVTGTAAATATRDDAVLIVPIAGAVTGVAIVPSSTLTGAATDNKTLSLINKGLTGGDTRVAATQTFALTTNVATAFDEFALTVSGTAATVACVAGDVLALSQIKVGNGLTVPDMLVKVSIVATE